MKTLVLKLKYLIQLYLGLERTLHCHPHLSNPVKQSSMASDLVLTFLKGILPPSSFVNNHVSEVERHGFDRYTTQCLRTGWIITFKEF